MHIMKKVRLLFWLMILVLGVGVLLTACGDEKKEQDGDVHTTLTLLLRDGETGMHHQMEVKLWEIDADERVVLARLQDLGVRITVSVPKAPDTMNEDERRELIQNALDAYEKMEDENGKKPNDPSNNPEPNPGENPVPPIDPVGPNDPVEPNDPMKEPITLQLKDAASGKTYSFTFDAVTLSESEKNLVSEQADKGTLTMEITKDPANMTDAEKEALLDAVIALLSYVPPQPPAPIATVFVDAGHGFTNSVGVPDKGSGEGSPYHELTGLYESDLNLAIAMHLKDKLLKAGFAVVTSRESEVNKYLSVNDRVRLINASNADIFISVHCNSAGESAKGARVYWHKNNDSASISSVYAQTVADAINELGGVTNKEAYADQGNYAVVRDVHIPAVLVETCFITNKEDAEMASDPQWAERMAEAICRGICNQFIDR